MASLEAFVLRTAPEFDASNCFEDGGRAASRPMQPFFADVSGVDADFLATHGLEPPVDEFPVWSGWGQPVSGPGLTGTLTPEALMMERNDEDTEELRQASLALLKTVWPVLQAQTRLRGFDYYPEPLYLGVVPVYERTHRPFGRLATEVPHIDNKAVLQATLIVEGPQTAIAAKAPCKIDGQKPQLDELKAFLAAQTNVDIFAPRYAKLGQMAVFSGGSPHWAELATRAGESRIGVTMQWWPVGAGTT